MSKISTFIHGDEGETHKHNKKKHEHLLGFKSIKEVDCWTSNTVFIIANSDNKIVKRVCNSKETNGSGSFVWAFLWLLVILNV